MNRLLILAITAIAATAAAARPPQPAGNASPQTYGIAFYNLENLFDTINSNGSYDLEFSPDGPRKWDTAKYRSKISRIAEAISAMTTGRTPEGPAIIGIAEVENKGVIVDLVQSPRLAGRNLGIIHHDSPDPRGIDVALLYNPAMFSPTEVTVHPLKVGPETNSLTRDVLCVTGVLGGTDTLSVLVNHWPSRRGGQKPSEHRRIAAAALCRQIADSLWTVRPHQGIIIMGDLNDDPHDTSCAVTLGASKRAADVLRHGFYNPWWKILDLGRGTLTYRGDWNLFDQIIVSGTLLKSHSDGLHFRRAHINNFDFLRDDDGLTPKRTYRSGRWLDGYSDHFPTEIFLERPHAGK